MSSHPSSTTTSVADGQMFGFRFERLPDFLSDHTLLGDKPESRIAEHARRWTQFVGGLWTDHPITYSLRYQFEPNPDGGKGGSLAVFLLIEFGQCDAEASGFSARDWLRTLEIRLCEFGFQPIRLKPEELARLKLRRYPYAKAVLQRETFVQTAIAHDGEDLHYLVLPWWGMAGPFLVPIQILCAQEHPCCLSVSLFPTSLSPDEQAYLYGMARFGATTAGTSKALTENRDGAGPKSEVSDPQAEWLGRIYAAQSRRLDHQVFFAGLLCFSDSEAAVGTVANSIANGVSEELPFALNGTNDIKEHSHAEVSDVDSYSAAESMRHGRFHYEPSGKLMLAANGADDTSPYRVPYCEAGELGAVERLRYLVDAAGAATVFRFPVNVRGGIPGIPVRQVPPDFNPGSGAKLNDATILLGSRATGHKVRVPLSDFRKHALITGFTGSGKTNTMLHLLEQLWRDHGIPFLVIESAKAEYRGFIRVRDRKGQLNGFQGVDASGLPLVRIYTVGNESCAPFRLNPFELQKGVRLEAHLGRLQACFEAAIPQGTSGGPLPSLLADALPMIYEEKGWSLLDAGYERGLSPFAFPTMRDLKEMLSRLLEKPDPARNRNRGRGYVGEVLNNVQGYVAGRVGALLQGSKGFMFDTEQSVPLDELFTKPTVLELNDLNEADKGMVVMFLLVMLREFRERNATPGRLGHVTVVEEAHNVLSNPSPGAASEAQEKAVQAFCNMLTEIRSLGEGLLIADQSPQKLARDAMRNTNVQITHQLRDSQDRNAIADSTLMSEEQRDYLGKIEAGWAACFFTGSEKATFVKIPQFDQCSSDDPDSGKGLGFGVVSDEDLRAHMSPLTNGHMQGPLLALCAECQSKCDYRRSLLLGVAGDSVSFKARRTKFARACQITAKGAKPETWLRQIHAIMALQLVQRAQLAVNADSFWCAAIHLCPDGFFTDRGVGRYRRQLTSVEFPWVIGDLHKRGVAAADHHGESQEVVSTPQPSPQKPAPDISRPPSSASTPGSRPKRRID